MEKLALVMPVYNEEEAIENVIKIWCEELDKYELEYKIFAYNDGSKDKTSEILHGLEEKYANLKAIDKPNSGHGPTILQGYRECSKNYDWIFQIDSDNEMGPEGFYALWEKRSEYGYLVGIRDNRIQPFARKMISIVSRLTIKIFYGTKGPYDVNSPYRLMRSNLFERLYNAIPENTFAPNVIISGFVANKKIKFFEIPVECKLRTTGEVSIKKWKLLKAAFKSFKQTICFSFGVKKI
ncbi:MAG: glycosyltransferase family 2 protein [Candidatus Gastranaerophilales bacterium]|nr:glycosyltransferase family 2 protein [Candidatus Gastranaerophilales bacterium]